MAFVIYSAGSLARSTTRTISMRLFASLATGAIMLVLIAGFALGFGLAASRDAVGAFEMEWPWSRAEIAPPVVEGEPEPGVAVALVGMRGVGADLSVASADSALAFRSDEPRPVRTATIGTDQRYLIDRLGELTGRMIHLEAEAMELATRIGVIKEFETRINLDEAENAPKGRAARTQPGAPAGGPLLDPREGENARPHLDPYLSTRAEDPPVEDLLTGVELKLEQLAGFLAELDRAATSLNLAHMFFPARHPVDGIAISSGFGNRVDPISRRRAFHSGVDFTAPTGTPIVASAGGRVIFAGRRSQYGLTVEIEHGAGLVTRYAHASKVLVNQGQIVRPGDRIALIGSTGRSTGPHLHFEILRDGHFVDPSVYLARR